ncbi:MAG: PH domain-containing protein [Sporichthyaceae bacterium]
MRAGALAGVAPTRPEGSFFVGKYLLPAERVIVVQQRHWAHLAIPLSIFIGGLLAAIAVDIVLPPGAELARDVVWLLWAGAVAYLGFGLLNWWADRFVVTNKRVMLAHGIVVRQVDMMPLGKVTDMRYERSVPGRVLGYGVFVMESAGQDQALSRVSFIRQPDWLYREICALLFTPEQPGGSPSEQDDGTGTGRGPARRALAGFGPEDPDPDAPPA